MKDEKGLYYHPDPTDTKTRVYVREGLDGPEFRLWHAEHPDVWDRHGWLAFSVVSAAALMYRDSGKGSNPLTLYDCNVANALLKDAARKNGY